MHFHNSSTQNCDDHILFIMTGNAHKESCHKLSLILVREQGLYIIKTDCSDELGVAFTIKEKHLFNGRPILAIGAAPFLSIVCFIIWLPIGLVSGIATKAAIALSIFSLQIIMVVVLC